jgi:hypothetical protein
MPFGEKDRVMGAMTMRLGRVSPLTVKGRNRASTLIGSPREMARVKVANRVAFENPTP